MAQFVRIAKRSAAGLLLACCVGHVTFAQHVLINVTDQPLDVTLARFSERFGIDFVYADRLVDGESATCSYSGPSLEMAIRCLLSNSGLEAQFTEKRQVVLRGKTRSTVPEKSRTTYTEQVEGIVIDSETGSALSGAHVWLDIPNRGAATNADGKFRLSQLGPGEYRIRISHLGFEPEVVTLHTGSDQHEIVMHPARLASNTVLVEAERDPSLQQKNPTGSVSLLRGYHATSGAHAANVNPVFSGVSWVPGLHRTGELGGNLVVRGGQPDQDRIIVDGAPLYQPHHTQALFAVLQPDALAEFTLYPGILPAQLGGTVASVVDARLRDGFSGRREGRASLSSTTAEVSTRVPMGSRLAGMFAARRSQPLLYRDQSLGLWGEFQPEAGSTYDLATRLSFRPGHRNSLAFTHYRGGESLSASPIGETSRLFGQSDWRNGLYTLSHRYVHGSRLLLHSNAYATSFSGRFEENLSSPGGEPVSRSSERIADVGLRVDADYFPAVRHKLGLGFHVARHSISWRHATIEDSPNSLLKSLREDRYAVRALEAGAYVSDAWDVTDRFTIVPSLRLSYFGDDTSVILSPRVHSTLEVVPQYLTARAAYSKQAQNIHHVRSFSTTSLASGFTRWTVASQGDVQPGLADHLLVGLSSRPNARWYLSAEVYWRKLTNVFIHDGFYDGRLLDVLDLSCLTCRSGSNSSQRFGDFTQGNSKAYGVEVVASYKLRTFGIWTSYTMSRSLSSLGLSSAYRPSRFDTPHTLRASIGSDGSHLRWNISTEVRSGYPTSHSFKETLHDKSLARLPTYRRVDATLGYHFNAIGLGWDLEARVYNLTNQENVVGYSYLPELLSLRRVSQFGVGRWPAFRFGITW